LYYQPIKKDTHPDGGKELNQRIDTGDRIIAIPAGPFEVKITGDGNHVLKAEKIFTIGTLRTPCYKRTVTGNAINQHIEKRAEDRTVNKDKEPDPGRKFII
jgi:hypothetical protein